MANDGTPDPEGIDAFVPTADEHFEALMGAERSLLDADPSDLTAGGVLIFLAQVQNEQSRLAALEVHGLTAFAGAHSRQREVMVIDPASDRERLLVIEDEAAEEVAAALRRSPLQMRHQLADARLLAGPLARTRRALETGRITAGHARAVVEAARRLSTASVAWQDPSIDTEADAADRAAFQSACALLEKRVLRHAERCTVARTRLLARRVVACVDAAGQEERRRRARANVDVSVSAEDDGLALLMARLPMIDAARVWAALDARARRSAADCAATLGQLRVSALVDAVCGPADGADALIPVGGLSPAAAVTATINVTIPLDSLLGLAEDPGSVSLGYAAAEPVSAESIRELLHQEETPATLRRLVMDTTTGHLIDRGRRTYAVDGSLRAFIALRDGVCRFPGCLRPASRCQMDHATAWQDGGASDRDNVGPLCTRHHQLKTHAHWDITVSFADGTCTWRSPLGRVYHSFPLGPFGPVRDTGRGSGRASPPTSDPERPLTGESEADPPSF
jgi:hypothetical protein